MAALGLTATRRAVLWDEDRPLRLACGRALAPVEVAYETYGELSAARDNVVVLCHALTGDAHAAGHHGDPGRRGWWDTLVGPGRAVDTERWFVVCANLLGGCAGTTGPSSVDPATGRVYGLRFPPLAVADLVTVQQALLRSLGVDRVHAAIGGSLGGMQVLQWLLDAPGEVERAVIVAASARLSPQNLALSAVQRAAILSDPDFAGGDYAERARAPDAGLAVARKLGHITYLSEAGMARKFATVHDERVAPPMADARAWLAPRFDVERYLEHQADTFLDRFDALSYLYLTRVMDDFDPFADRAAVREAIARGPAPAALVLSFDSDWRFPTPHSRFLAGELRRAGVGHVVERELSSPWGHDAFLLEDAAYHATVAAFLEGAPIALAEGSPAGLAARDGR